MADKPKDLWEELAFMDPAMRDEILAGMGYTPTGAFQGFGGAEEPLDEEAYAQAYMGSPLPLGFGLSGVGALPQYTSSGNLDPRDMSQVQQGVNLAQDYGSLGVDNSLTSQFGPGAYGAEAFTPEVKMGKEIIMKGQQQLDNLAQAGGWEGYVANRLKQGDSPSQAMAALQSFVEAIPEEERETSPDASDEYKEVLHSLPRMRPQQQGTDAGLVFNPDTKKFEPPAPPEDIGFWGDYDYDRIFNRAVDLTEAVMNDDVPGYTDEATGRFYETEPEIIKTPQMEWYDRYGLPYPTESYEDPKYAEQMLNREEGTTPEQREFESQDYLRGYEDVQAKTGDTYRNIAEQTTLDDEMAAAWEAAQPRPAVLGEGAATRPQTQTVPGSAGVGMRPEDLMMPTGNLVNGRRTVPMTQTVPGSAGVEWLSQMVEGGNELRHPRTEEAVLPTNVLMGGRTEQVANQPTMRSVPGRVGGQQMVPTDMMLPTNVMMGGQREPVPEPPESWLADIFEQQTVPSPAAELPRVRTLPGGLMGPVGRERPGLWGAMGGALAGPADERFAPRPPIGAWTGFSGRGVSSAMQRPPAPEGTTRQMTANDVSDKARAGRATKTQAKAVDARVAQRQYEEQDPRLNDMQRRAYLYLLAQAGRTPLGDVQAQRNRGIRGLGL